MFFGASETSPLLLDYKGDVKMGSVPEYSIIFPRGEHGWIMALRNGETHIALVHLLDETTGEYNKSYIKKYIKDKDVSLIKCVKRIQGLMVKKGNPLNIKKLNDIVDHKARFANRQRGSGTRLLLDYI